MIEIITNGLMAYLAIGLLIAVNMYVKDDWNDGCSPLGQNIVFIAMIICGWPFMLICEYYDNKEPNKKDE